MPVCSRCGAALGADDRVCSSCGLPVDGSPGVEAGDTSATLAYQSVGVRFVAQVIDGVVGLVVFLVVGLRFADAFGGRTETGFELSGGPALSLMLVMFLFWVAYFALQEAYWNGQTLGKKLVGIRVVTEEGQPIDLQASVVRNVLRIVDGFAVYLVAAVLVWTSSRRQRLGDRVARTVVVKTP